VQLKQFTLRRGLSAE